MKSMTETANTDDQNSDDIIDQEPRPSEGPTAEARQHDEKTAVESGGRPWPAHQGKHSSLRGVLHETYESLSYSYMNRIFEKGMKQFKSGDHLDLEDLFEVPQDMSSAHLVDKFWQCYEEGWSLRSVLWHMVVPIFVPASFYEMIYVMCRVSMPICLRQLLLALEQNRGSSVIEDGLKFAVLISLASLVGAIAQNRTTFLSTQCGIVLRASLTSAIYEHSLKLSPSGRQGLTSGEITNLVAVDTQKIFDVMVEAQNLWSCPVLIIVVSALLWIVMGPEMVIGVALLIFFLPIVRFFVSRMLRLRKERSKLTDVRINILTSMLQGIRVTKLNHYETKVEEHVLSVREKEMKLLRQELYMWGWVMTSAVCSPLLATTAAFSFYALFDKKNIITPSDAFSALLLFAILRFPINMAARLVGKLAQALEGLRRIEEFLQRETRPDVEEHHKSGNWQLDDPGDETVVNLKGGSFTIRPDDIGLSRHDGYSDHLSVTSQSQYSSANSKADEPVFNVRNISFELKKSEVIAIVGKVGSGKTTLLRALLGEVPAQPGTELWMSGALSYAPQIAFILNRSLRENILFGCDFDEARYEEVIDACCLRDDVRHLGPAADLTQIGERGVTLSGGQKQRVALARACYAKGNLALLDDVFSALDANTAGRVFDGLFNNCENSTGVLRNRGTLLVTHAEQFLPRVDKILVMSDGEPSFFGTFKELNDFAVENESAKALIDHSTKRTGKDKKKKSSKLRKEGANEDDGIIMTVEERNYGVSSFVDWATWFINAGGLPFVITQLVFLVLDRGLFVMSDWWLSQWSDSAYEELELLFFSIPPQSDGREAQETYVAVYCIIVFLSIIATSLRSQWMFTGSARCAELMFAGMAHRVLRAPLSYFETVPLGRILNRFTYDVEVLDVELSISMTGLVVSSSWLISAVVVMVSVLPWMLLGIAPVTIMYGFIQYYYRMSGPDLQRIDAVSRSPLQASLAEGIEGSSSIRAYSKEKTFAKEFRRSVDANTSAMMNYLAAQRWLGVRIEVLGTSVFFALSTSVVCFNNYLKIPPGLVGLALQWAVVFSAALNFFFLRLTESEARITSIERVRDATGLPQEKSWETDESADLGSSWPAKGELVFDSVCMRYRQDLPLALDCVSFKLSPGMRCGVVGRTGSGKTSLTASLFRLVEIESGHIILDGIDLANIGLSDVRGRSNGLRILPQDPVLYAGTLRDCIDPFHVESSEKILEALQAVNHNGAAERGLAILDDPVEEGGSNFSVGERQLLCLARAIVEEPRVLVLDEATASVDTQSDSFIQQMLRTRFQNTTLLTIAHRLHTIMDYDIVVVMEKGKCVELDHPARLLEDPDGIFTSFVEATGHDSAAELRHIAQKSWDTRKKFP
uniref:ATP-dependent transporter ycf16 n=1 Tax=Amphora coffeiformis TaxID=265554 RepID=A0A7S3L4V8_9STRA